MTQATKHDANKARLDLVPPRALLAVGMVLTYGAHKYGARNWQLGMDWGRLVGAALRHLMAWQSGEELDPESQLPHLAHAACCILFILEYTLTNTGSDNRAI